MSDEREGHDHDRLDLHDEHGYDEHGYHEHRDPDDHDDDGFLGEEVVEERGPRPRRSRSAASCLLVLLVVGGVVAALGVGLFSGMDRVKDLFADPADYDGDGRGSVLFEVEQGDSVSMIGQNLEAEGVVASVEAFTDAAAEEGGASTIQVGFYQLARRMSSQAALDVLLDPANLVQSTVTVPEGLRVEDALKVLAKGTDIPLAQLERAAEDARAIGLPAYAKGNPEGYLFPATYAVPPNADAVDVLSDMVDRWRQAAQEADLEDAAKRLGYTPAELMTVASLVESEANRDADRGKVARVIYNRLEGDETNGLLQIDATVNYALGRDLGLGLTPEQLDVDSPYNTRRYPGLPPGPIESPGDAAIEAAANPTPGDWIYYVTVNLDTGETKFTDDYDEFLRFKNVELADFCAGSDRC